MWMTGSSASANVEQTTLVGCGRRYDNSSNFGDHGGFEFDEQVSVTCSDLNFTDCKIYMRGCAILARYGSYALSVTRTTCLRCDSETVIDTGRTSLATISFSNFYECPVHSLWVLTCYKESTKPAFGGMAVSNCIFFANSNSQDVGFYGPGTKFTIENCVFSASFPADTFVVLTGENFANQVGSSYKLFAIDTQYCPAVRLATLSKSPLASTRPFAPTSPLLPSAVHRLSSGFDQTFLPPPATSAFTEPAHPRRRVGYLLRTSVLLWIGYFSDR
jgi:hypothetical protein